MSTSGRIQRAKFLTGVCAAALMLLTWPVAAPAQEDGLKVELNKLEPVEAACRAYLLFENHTADNIRTLKLDLVMFDGDGVITKRLAVEGGPLPAGKTNVKPFDIEGVDCATLSRVLLNGVLGCSDGDGERGDCLDLLQTGSRNNVEFFK